MADWLLQQTIEHNRRERRRKALWRVKFIAYPIAAAAIVYLWYMTKVIL